MEQKMFSDGSSSAYVELPVKTAGLGWTRGDPKLAAVFASDPALYLGGWRAFANDRDGNPYPVLPVPQVERVSSDGKNKYLTYATNFISILPINHRTRWELRQKYQDESGNEKQKVVAISHQRIQGYEPHRQVFCLVFDRKSDTFGYGIVYLNKWNTFISFEQAGQKWNKVEVPDGKLLIRRYGTLGQIEKNAQVPTPIMVKIGQGTSTPIEAVGVGQPRFIDQTQQFVDLWKVSNDWRECTRWNGEGKLSEPESAKVTETPEAMAFRAQCEVIGITNIEAEDLLARAKGDYKLALASITAPPEDSVPPAGFEQESFM